MTDAPPPTGRPDEPAIVLDSVTKAFGDHVVLSDVSMRVAEGSVCAMIGPSGAGKSTLLRCINLLETPDSGTISVEGVTIHADHTTRSSRKTLRRCAPASAWSSRRSTSSRT